MFHIVSERGKKKIDQRRRSGRNNKPSKYSHIHVFVFDLHGFEKSKRLNKLLKKHNVDLYYEFKRRYDISRKKLDDIEWREDEEIRRRNMEQFEELHKEELHKEEEEEERRKVCPRCGCSARGSSRLFYFGIPPKPYPTSAALCSLHQ